MLPHRASNLEDTYDQQPFHESLLQTRIGRYFLHACLGTKNLAAFRQYHDLDESKYASCERLYSNSHAYLISKFNF